MDTTGELLALEHEGWRALCEGTGDRFYGELMTEDGVMVLADGSEFDREAVVTSLDQTPTWGTYELSDTRRIDTGPESATLVHTGRAVRGSEPPSSRAWPALTAALRTGGASRSTSRHRCRGEAGSFPVVLGIPTRPGGTAMASEFTELAIDCADADALARFWCSVLDHEVQEEDDDGCITIGPPDGNSHVGPVLTFAPVPEGKTVKNRLHIDLDPTDREQDAEVRRLLDLGARYADVGQGEESWIVLADPEGNEFCVLAGRRP